MAVQIKSTLLQQWNSKVFSELLINIQARQYECMQSSASKFHSIDSESDASSMNTCEH